MTPLEIIRRAQGSRVVDEDGRSVTLELLPPLSAEEFAHLEGMIPCRLPAEVRELLSFSRGFANGPWEGADFSGLTHEESFGMEGLPFLRADRRRRLWQLLGRGRDFPLGRMGTDLLRLPRSAGDRFSDG